MKPALILHYAKILVLAACVAPSIREGAAEQVKFDVEMSHPVLKADGKQKTYLKITLTGFEVERKKDRTPANIAMVIDKSGSMTGSKIEKCKEAARLAIDMLDPNDIVSVVAYDSTVSVLVPATKISDRSAVIDGINRLAPGGQTALFAGVSKGAAEVRKFLDKNHINRIVLLSDGLANEGPSSPSDLGSLGASLAKEGISVTTLGLGADYNEDLMTQLAGKSDGDHAFIETPQDLARIFKMEFDAILSIVAQEVMVKVTCAEGVRPLRALGPEAEFAGNSVTVDFNLMYSGHEEYILLELEVPAKASGTALEVAKVEVTYNNLVTEARARLSQTATVAFSDSIKLIAARANSRVLVAVAARTAVLKNEEATELRDSGKVREARQLLIGNAAYLSRKSKEFDSKFLDEMMKANLKDAESLSPEKWRIRRKMMRDRQHRIYLGPRF
ncbi:MAG: VWA domain-containing protein [Planctomycetota bacterium]|jgi:Ca-activated chloride channel family protein|nr:VWA domain-containing protein [Planctomycetota bacterium]